MLAAPWVFTTTLCVPEGDPNPARHVELVGKIPSQYPLMPGYSHSFGMSQNYLVFIEQPLRLDLIKLASTRLRGKAIKEGFKYYENYSVSALWSAQHLC